MLGNVEIDRTSQLSFALNGSRSGFVDIFRGPDSAGPDAQFFGELTLKAFGTMGIRDYDGAPKGSLFERWQQALQRPAPVR